MSRESVIIPLFERSNLLNAVIVEIDGLLEEVDSFAIKRSENFTKNLRVQNQIQSDVQSLKDRLNFIKSEIGNGRLLPALNNLNIIISKDGKYISQFYTLLFSELDVRRAGNTTAVTLQSIKNKIERLVELKKSQPDSQKTI